jgi:hypothetical protein
LCAESMNLEAIEFIGWEKGVALRDCVTAAPGHVLLGVELP